MIEVNFRTRHIRYVSSDFKSNVSIDFHGIPSRQVTRCEKMSNDMQQQLEYMHSLQETIRMNYRQEVALEALVALEEQVSRRIIHRFILLQTGFFLFIFYFTFI